MSIDAIRRIAANAGHVVSVWIGGDEIIADVTTREWVPSDGNSIPNEIHVTRYVSTDGGLSFFDQKAN